MNTITNGDKIEWPDEHVPLKFALGIVLLGQKLCELLVEAHKRTSSMTVAVASQNSDFDNLRRDLELLEQFVSVVVGAKRLCHKWEESVNWIEK